MVDPSEINLSTSIGSELSHTHRAITAVENWAGLTTLLGIFNVTQAALQLKQKVESSLDFWQINRQRRN